MQNTIMARPAITGHVTGLALKYDTFRFAIDKALSLQPRVEYVSLARTMVETAQHNGTMVCVTFTPHGAGLWVCCSCQLSYSLRNPQDYPKPCFHAAAAALARHLFELPASLGALGDDALRRTEQHQEKSDGFRPQVALAPAEIQTILAWVGEYDTQIDDFLNQFGSASFHWLYDNGYLSLDGEYVVVIN
jgi:hypothetical protein